jgi:hypothetical protein
MTREQFLLLKLAEECAEVSQRAIKQIQFGANQVQKAGEVAGGQGPAPKEVGLTNGQRLKNELLDLIAIVKLLEENNQFPEITFEEYIDTCRQKVNKLNKYIAFSRSLGELDGDWTI